jgi:hypothetical protein
MIVRHVMCIGWEPLGLFCLYVFLPIHTVTLIWFIRRRKFFPIVGRLETRSLSIIAGSFSN